MPAADRKKWAQEVLEALKQKTDIDKDEFIILAGKKHFEYVKPALKKCKTPLTELGGIGKQLHWLNQMLNGAR